MITQRFRRIWKFLTPPWLQGDDGDEVLFALGYLKDAFVQRVRDGLEARMPSRASNSANELTVGERGLLRGRSESRESIVARMLAWRTPRTHVVRGNAYEALVQLWHYWGGIKASTVDSHGRRHIIELADDPGDVDSLADPDTYTPWIDSGNTTWDDEVADDHPSKFWVFLEPHAALNIEPTPDFGDAALWGGALGTPGYTLGQVGVTPADVLAHRSIFQDLNWHPGHTTPQWAVLVFDGDPLPEPDGTWANWSRNDGGTQVANRDTTYRYWALSPDVNRYSGIATNYPEAMTDVEGTGTYDGDPDSFPATVTFPAGRVYAGDPTRFAANFQLVDDGSIPR